MNQTSETKGDFIQVFIRVDLFLARAFLPTGRVRLTGNGQQAPARARSHAGLGKTTRAGACLPPRVLPVRGRSGASPPPPGSCESAVRHSPRWWHRFPSPLVSLFISRFLETAPRPLRPPCVLDAARLCALVVTWTGVRHVTQPPTPPSSQDTFLSHQTPKVTVVVGDKMNDKKMAAVVNRKRIGFV